jgi:hypothetical protein
MSKGFIMDERSGGDFSCRTSAQEVSIEKTHEEARSNVIE